MSNTFRRIARAGALVIALGILPGWFASAPALAGEAKIGGKAVIERETGRSRKLARKRGADTVSMFRDKSGATVLTNRTWKYRDQQGFEEVKLDLKPISKPKIRMHVPSGGVVAAPAYIKELVDYYSRLYGVPANLIFAVIRAESGFNPNAQSPAGACGLMQLMPATAVLMNVTNIFDPAENIAGGTQYLAKMLRIFNQDKRLALAGYNAGPNAVKRHGNKIPPYPETMEYVPRVLEYEKRFASMGYDRFRETPMDRPSTATVKIASAPVKHPYVVHFHSGLTQPADSVREKDPYYEIDVSGRSFSVRKDLVKKVEQSS